MSSRAKILKEIAANKPGILPLPALPSAPVDTERFVKIQKFMTLLESIGGKVIEVETTTQISQVLSSLTAQGLKVACLCPEIGEGNMNISPRQSATELEAIDSAFMYGSFGIAENGSVWLYESQFINRLLPFICQHLVIVLDAGAILSDMHEAYRRIKVDAEGYGLFLAGPSKTADIEQSLVIGAHGARSTTVYLIDRDGAGKPGRFSESAQTSI